MRAKRGFTLIEMVVVIAVMGILFTILFAMTRSVVSQQRYQTTRARISNVDGALTLFVSQYKRLPCPADGRVASSTTAAGQESATGSGTSRTCNSAQQYGVVPWATLGLTASDVEDGWGTRLTYRVAPDLVLDGSLDFSSCDPAGSGGINTIAPIPPWCFAAGTGASQCNSANLASCTTPNNALTQSQTKGLVVENVAGSIIMDPRSTATPPVTTGAAYVMVSHGPEGGGGYDGQGNLQGSSVSPGTMEAKNFANIAYATPPASGAPTWYMVDDTINGTATTAHFDDFVSRPGILALATRAQLGPRSH